MDDSLKGGIIMIASLLVIIASLLAGYGRENPLFLCGLMMIGPPLAGTYLIPVREVKVACIGLVMVGIGLIVIHAFG